MSSFIDHISELSKILGTIFFIILFDLNLNPLYGHLSPISKSIQVRRSRHAGHCWRNRDELISDVLLWTPIYGRAKAGRPARTYIRLYLVSGEKNTLILMIFPTNKLTESNGPHLNRPIQDDWVLSSLGVPLITHTHTHTRIYIYIYIYIIFFSCSWKMH